MERKSIPLRNDLVEAWLRQSDVDMEAAVVLSQMKGDTLAGVCCYHAQQAAEKALKALLAGASRNLEKTHDLIRLLDLCEDIDPRLRALFHDAALLTPFATQSRYPDMGPQPNAYQARDALDAAMKIRAAVKILL